MKSNKSQRIQINLLIFMKLNQRNIMDIKTVIYLMYILFNFFYT
jgi:hypothetical protein